MLITGPPGIGKTTLVRNLIELLHAYRPAGFYTREIREEGIRKGFELVGLHGKRATLAHVTIQSPYRVGKYGVDVPGFERFLDGVPFFAPGYDLIVLDEIGKMECASRVFIGILETLLDGPRPVLSTVALKGKGTIAAVKQRSDVILLPMNRRNRGRMLNDVLKRLSCFLPALPEKKRPASSE